MSPRPCPGRWSRSRWPVRHSGVVPAGRLRSTARQARVIANVQRHLDRLHARPATPTDPDTDPQGRLSGCGFRNMDNYQRRVMVDIAVTRPARAGSMNRRRPAKTRRVRRDPAAGAGARFTHPPSLKGYAYRLYAVAGWTSLFWLQRIRQPRSCSPATTTPSSPRRTAGCSRRSSPTHSCTSYAGRAPVPARAGRRGGARGRRLPVPVDVTPVPSAAERPRGSRRPRSLGCEARSPDRTGGCANPVRGRGAQP